MGEEHRVMVCENRVLRGIFGVTVGEEHRLRVYYNRVLRGIFGTKRY